jgi:hypothetical protein
MLSKFQELLLFLKFIRFVNFGKHLNLQYDPFKNIFA